jgi:signal transduction histidine kinase
LSADSFKMLPMSPRKKALLAFVSALILLLVSGVAASVAIVRFLHTAAWTEHSYDVQIALGDIQSSLTAAARTRTLFLNSGDVSQLAPYDTLKAQVHQRLDRVRDLTKDNPVQRSLCTQLEDNILRRIELLDSSVELRKSGPLDDSTQLRLSRENVAAAADFSDIMQKMMSEEQSLLGQRKALSDDLFVLLLCILLAMFIFAILLLWIHFRLLSNELSARERSDESSRRLSVRVLQLQDEERRKFSRELHDSLGQLLALAKMHMSVLREKNPHDELLAEIDKLLTESVTETRTISHLLHPPLLDEVGIASAARWYAEGFAKRSGIELVTDIPDDVGRLPRPAELVVFRVLQESLTNIHRHSKSLRAEVSLRSTPSSAILRVRDYGKGMPRELLANFLKTGTDVGVGLAGMRERVREQGGRFEIQSGKTGTTITVTMPIVAAQSAAPQLTSAISPD